MLNFIDIVINKAARRLKMENVDLDVDVDVNIYIGEEWHDCKSVSVLELEMINSRVFAEIEPHLTFTNSFAKFRFVNTVFEEIYFKSVRYVGLASYVFDKCTFTEALRC